MFEPRKDLEQLTDHQRRALPVVARWREQRRILQEEGRARARQGDALHQAGCMLYWAEGTKNRNVASVTNSDVNLLRFFHRFLTECLGVTEESLVVHIHFYTGNGLTQRQIEKFWLDALELPRSCLRKPQINVRPVSSNGQRGSKLPYGVCTLRILESTWLVPAHLWSNPGVRRFRRASVVGIGAPKAASARRRMSTLLSVAPPASGYTS